jgi:nicotinamide-nucleotide amidase
VDCCVQQDLVEQAQLAMDRLRALGLTVVTAESCTGGLVAACLTHARNASSSFLGAFVAYTKTYKSDVLGVDERLLREQGAVTQEVARQMAEGALRIAHASVAIAITGVLGPDPDEDDNPPGLVYVGLARAGRPTQLVRCDFQGCQPDRVRARVVLKALELLRDCGRDQRD